MRRPPAASDPSPAGRRATLLRRGAVVATGLAVGAPLLVWEPLALAVGIAGGVVALQLRRRLREVHNTAEAPLATLMNLIEVRDGVSPGHAFRVSLVAAALAEAAGCDRREVDRVRRAAGLHNIGSLAITPGLLAAPAPLSPDEEREVAHHTVIGAEALSASVVSRELVPIVRHHHERWDGDGYPDRLAAEDIPLGARIVAVADTAVALRSPRPYRAALAVDDVVALLREGPSRQWDPRVVDHLATLIATLHPPVLTALEIDGGVGRRVDLPGDPPKATGWTPAARMVGASAHPKVTSLPAPVAASPPAGERGVSEHD